MSATPVSDYNPQPMQSISSNLVTSQSKMRSRPGSSSHHPDDFSIADAMEYTPSLQSNASDRPTLTHDENALNQARKNIDKMLERESLKPTQIQTQQMVSPSPHSRIRTRMTQRKLSRIVQIRSPASS